MWAPADLFGRPAAMALRPLKHLTTYLYENPFALALVVLLAAGLIALAARFER